LTRLLQNRKNNSAANTTRLLQNRKNNSAANTDNAKGKLLVTLFAPAEAGFRRYAPQLLLLHPKQIRDSRCTQTRASARNQNPAP
jgi:hypothetical protein